MWAVGGVSGLLEWLTNKEGGYDRVKGEMDFRAMVLLPSLQFPWTISWRVHCENFGVDETQSSSREFCLLSSHTNVIQGDEQNREHNAEMLAWNRGRSGRTSQSWGQHLHGFAGE